jgi:predicted RNase H-like HicB family nuclease
MSKRRYAVVLEKAPRNWSAYVPDVDGCVATGKTAEETLARIREALEFHFEGMASHGEAIPEPAARVDYVEVEAPAPAAAR